MKEAFTYMFKDNCYYKKALVFLILTFIESACIAFAQMNSCAGMCPFSAGEGIFTPNKTNVLIFQLIGLLFNLLVVGYFNTCVEAITKQVNNIILPFFNIVNCFFKGLKYFVAIFIPIVLYSFIIGFIQVFNPLVANIVLGIILLLYLVLSIGFIWLFANEKSFFAFLSFRKVIKKVIQSPLNYFKYLLFIAIVCVLTFTLKFAFEFIFALFPISPLVTMLISTLMSAVISAYLTFVLVYLTAKSIKADL